MKIYSMLAFIILTPIFCIAQSSDRIIDINQTIDLKNIIGDTADGKAYLTDETALEIVEVMVEDKSITFGQSFTAGDDWLKTMRIKLKNVSYKAISRIEIPLIFPETKTEKGYKVSSIGYSAFDEKTGKLDERKVVNPNEIVELSQTRYEEIKQKMKESNLTKLNRITVSRITSYFKDGTFLTIRKLPVSK